MLHKLLIGGVGIYVAYLSMSYLSEKLYHFDYPATAPPSSTWIRLSLQLDSSTLRLWYGWDVCSARLLAMSFRLLKRKHLVR